MNLTPRQALAIIDFGGELDRMDASDRIVLTAIGAQGDKKSIEAALKDLSE